VERGWRLVWTSPLYTYMHPIPPFSSIFYYFAVCNLVVKKSYSYVKKCWGRIYPLAPPPTPHNLRLCLGLQTHVLLICLYFNLPTLWAISSWNCGYMGEQCDWTQHFHFFFNESATSLSVPLPSVLNLSRPVFINTYSLLRVICLWPTCVLQIIISEQL